MGYDIEGQRIESRPASMKKMAQCRPIYKEMPGWQEDISQARQVNDLPENARAYIRTIEEITDVPVSFISVGPGRDETIVVRDPF